MQAQGPVSTRFSRHSFKTCSTAHAHSPAAGHPTEQLIYMLWGLAAREGTKKEIHSPRSLHALGSGRQGGKQSSILFLCPTIQGLTT